MTAPAPLDCIVTYLGELPPDEYEQRRQIRTCRNVASFKAHQHTNEDARKLCWMVAECASVWLYMPATVEQLTEAARYLRRLLICADQAESLWETL